jgi:hypothetical protein
MPSGCSGSSDRSSDEHPRRHSPARAERFGVEGHQHGGARRTRGCSNEITADPQVRTTFFVREIGGVVIAVAARIKALTTVAVGQRHVIAPDRR